MEVCRQGNGEVIVVGEEETWEMMVVGEEEIGEVMVVAPLAGRPAAAKG